MENIEKIIIKILKGNKRRPNSQEMSEKLGLSYNTTSKYLKKMVEKGVIKRYGIGVGNPGNHWTYRHYLK